jgi:hypothetical protein
VDALHEYPDDGWLAQPKFNGTALLVIESSGIQTWNRHNKRYPTKIANSEYASMFGDAKDFMLENQTATVALHEGNPLYIDLPASVELEITYTEPGLQGDRSSAGTKPATVETGYEIQVPLFITTGEKVKVDTRSGDYLGRISEK